MPPRISRALFQYIGQKNVDILFKNESASRSGSLKHRYAWSLIMWALVEGHVKEGTPVFEASSGNTAASLAYMCNILNVPFTAIVPDTIEEIKVKHIKEYGGEVVKVPSSRLIHARSLAEKNGGFFMNQFGNADKAEEFHESRSRTTADLKSANLFHEIIVQLESDSLTFRHFTGGTISSVGRYVKKYGINTEVVLADTQFSIYYDYVMYGRFKNESGAGLWVEPGMAGIGYGPMGVARRGETTSMDAAVIDRVVKVPDVAATAAMRILREQVGISRGSLFLKSLAIHGNLTILNITPQTSRLVIATLLADPGHYYDTTYYNREWIARKFARHGGLEAYDCWYTVISECLSSGDDPLLLGYDRCPNGLLS
ncbi:unnamed protein product [Haemonchus placei]|uniref:PALP domain-containing protein n=1 Tax=Haemonchus placei TaxID=6290 RepID=A0A158QL53_HAEPC|nr:unnamed protein product [Haemonchus placei]